LGLVFIQIAIAIGIGIVWVPVVRRRFFSHTSKTIFCMEALSFSHKGTEALKETV